MARLVPTEQRFRVAAQATLEESRRLIAGIARREHARVMATDPRPATFTRRVDGVLGASEDEVKPAGIIVYHYPRVEEAVQYAMEVLYDLSPVLSGDYRNHHTIFLDGQAVHNLKDWEPGREISIGNPMPYARKIEVGAMTMRVPGTDHVYEQGRKRLAARWGNVVRATFTFRSLLLPYVALGGRRGGRAAGPSLRRAANLERATRSPILIITPL